MQGISDLQASKQMETEQKRSAMSIKMRLFLGFASTTAIFLVVVFVTLFIVSTTKEFSDRVTNIELPTYDQFIDLNGELYQLEVVLQNYVLTEDIKTRDELGQHWENIAKIENIIDDLQKSWIDKNYTKMWQDAKAMIDKVKALQEKILDIESSNKNAALTSLTSEYIPLMKQLIEILNVTNVSNTDKLGLLDMQSLALHDGMHNIVSHLDMLQISEYILLLLSAIASVLIGYYISRSILRQISSFRIHSNKIASGDLTSYLKIDSNDEMGKLGEDLNIMTAGLATITKQITESCHNMVGALEEVRHAVDVQSSGSSEQASSINEITASLNEIEKSSAQTMDKAKTLGEVAERTRESGQTGLNAVEQSVNGMKAVRDKVQLIAQTILDLSNQTQQVGEITAVVNNLAQQSKMLALNASIEAAKAGDAGKGFAVVAAEVKNLAEQSEQSTTQVQKILQDIRQATEKAVMVTEEGTKGVDYGTSLVEQTGEIIRKLNDVIHETTIASQQIEAAVRQEGAGIEQITAGMTEINQVTSTFVESARQTKEAIGNLAEIAKNIKTYVDSYKV